MKTVLSLNSINFNQQFGIDSTENNENSLFFDKLCIDHENGFWELHFEVKKPEAANILPKLRQSLLKETGVEVKRILFQPKYTPGFPILQFLNIHWDDICYDISCKSEILTALLDPVEWEVKGDAVNIKVSNPDAIKTLKKEGCGEIILKKIKQHLNTEIKIEFSVGDFSSVIEEKIKQHVQKVKAEEEKKISASLKQRENILYSIPNAKHGEITEIKELTDNKPVRQKFTISGKVVSYDPPGQRHYQNEKFSLTDFTSTIDCSIRQNNGDYNNRNQPPKQFLKLKAGQWITVTGTLEPIYNKEDVELKVELVERTDSKIRRDTCEKRRIELHAHTKMSQMDGLSDVSELIERAAYWDHPAIGVTDHGNVHVFPEAVSLGKKHGIKVMLGMEGYLTNHSSEKVSEVISRKNKGKSLSRDEVSKFKKEVYHIIIYAANLTGLRNLYELVSISNTEYFYSKPLIPRDILMKYRNGLIIGSACESGEIFKLVLSSHLNQIEPEELNKRIADAVELYDYLEVQPISNNSFFISKNIVKSEDDLRELNKKVVDIGKKFSKDVVATGDVHVIDDHDALLRKILQVGQGYDKGGDDNDNRATLSFKTTDEMLEEFSYLGEETARKIVVDTPAKIAGKIEEIKPIPDGFHPPTLEGATEELKGLCQNRCEELYGKNPHPIVKNRKERELNDIIGNRFADLYMLAQKIVKKSLDDGYIVGSRGSVGSSFVAFLSGITEVNSLPAHYTCPKCFFTEFIGYDDTGKPREAPLDGIEAELGVDLPPRKCSKCGIEMNRYGFDIPFETFVGFKGDKTPDIDLNFASEYQSRAHHYIEELFGTEHVFRAGTMSTLQSKTAFGFVKKYLEGIDEEWPQAEIERIIKGLTGIKRTTGQHPGGMIILPKDKHITEFCPVQFPANKADSGTKTTHFDYHSMEDQLLKLDILGHDDPTQIRQLTEYTGKDITKIPLDDQKTISIFSSIKALGLSTRNSKSKVGTLGIPEFGTEFVRGMLMDTRPKRFEDLIRISGLSHGTDVWLNNARDLIKAKTATLKNVICTRDDIMHYLIGKGVDSFAAFKIMEKVRKGKGLTPEDIEIMKAKNVPEWYISSCLKIKYMFPKAHAVAYVINAFRIAYCKVHFPVAFYASHFTVKRGALNPQIVAEGKNAIIKEMENLLVDGKRNLSHNDASALDSLEIALEMVERGVVMRKLDIYKSHSTRCIIENDEIIPPLTSFPGLGEAAAESVVAERQKEKFSSVEDIQRRTLCNRTILEKMFKSGVFGDLPESDQMSLF